MIEVSIEHVPPDEESRKRVTYLGTGPPDDVVAVTDAVARTWRLVPNGSAVLGVSVVAEAD